MPCSKQTNYSAVGYNKFAQQTKTYTGTGPFATEADCLNACKEGACCEGTTCSVKPACQCQGAGKTFNAVGTACSQNLCSCPYANSVCCDCFRQLAKKWPASITLAISGNMYWDYGCPDGQSVDMSGTYDLPINQFSNPSASDGACASYVLTPQKASGKVATNKGIVSLGLILAAVQAGQYASSYSFLFAHPCSTGFYYLRAEIAQMFNVGPPFAIQPGNKYYNCRESYWIGKSWNTKDSGTEYASGVGRNYAIDITATVTSFNYSVLP